MPYMDAMGNVLIQTCLESHYIYETQLPKITHKKWPKSLNMLTEPQ